MVAFSATTRPRHPPRAPAPKSLGKLTGERYETLATNLSNIAGSGARKVRDKRLTGEICVKQSWARQSVFLATWGARCAPVRR